MIIAETSLQQGSCIGKLQCLQSAELHIYLQFSVTCSTWPVQVRQHCSIFGWECLQPSAGSDKSLQGQEKHCSGRFWVCKLFHLAQIGCAFGIVHGGQDHQWSKSWPSPSTNFHVTTLCCLHSFRDKCLNWALRQFFAILFVNNLQTFVRKANQDRKCS